MYGCIVKSIMSDDGEMEEQGPGFKGRSCTAWSASHPTWRRPRVREIRAEQSRAEQSRAEKSPRSVAQSFVTAFRCAVIQHSSIMTNISPEVINMIGTII